MTITARRLRSPIGTMDRHEFTLRGRRWNLGQVVDVVRDPRWPEDVRLQALVNGELVEDVRRSRGTRIRPGDDVTVAPAFEAAGTLALIFVQLALFGVQTVYARRAARESPIARGDEASPTYNFAGIGTQRGPGAPIAIGYGSMRVGQQFLSSRTIRDTTRRWTDSETILVQVGLGIGPWQSIGGLGLGVCGEADFLGGSQRGFRPLPAGLRINDTAIQTDDPNVVAHVRSGSLGQSPMPSGLDDASTVYGLTAYELRSGVPRVYTTKSDEVDRLVLEWRFPQGLYESSGSGQRVYRLLFDVRFRLAGDLLWGKPDTVTVDFGRAAPGPVSWTKTYDLPQLGQWEVEVTRRTKDDQRGNGGNFTVSTSELDSITEQRLTRLAYPSMAMIGLEIQGNERIDGTLSSVTVPCDMRLLRRNTSGTWTPREWINADDGTKITGKNPAWIIADMLTLPHYGGGALGYEDSDLEIQTFRDFADYCDERVPIGDGKDEARHECSVYFDSDNESLDDAILTICKMSRAAYIREGSKHYIVFDHKKSRSLLLTSERANNVSLRYRNASGRPTSYLMQVLDQDQDYDLVEVNVEDKDAQIDVTKLDRDQLWQERVNLKGCTRRTQAVREAEFLHRANFYRDLDVSFDVTRWAIPLRIYDRFALALYVPRWYSKVNLTTGAVEDDDRPYHVRAFKEGSSTNTVYIDRELTIEGGLTWAVAIQATDGSGNDTVEIRNVTGVPPAGSNDLAGPTRPILFDGDPVTFEQDAQVVVGLTDKLVIDFIVLEKKIDPSTFKQTIVAEKYDERVYDVEAIEAPPGTGAGIQGIADGALLPSINRAAPQVANVGAQLTPDGKNLEVRWTQPAEARGQRFRVYSRRAGEEDAWSVQVETPDASALITPTTLGVDLELSVTSRPAKGTWPGPDTGVKAIVSGQEFATAPPPDIVSVSARQLSTGFKLEWPDAPSDDIDYYEIRRGPQWFGSPVAARVRERSAKIRDARCYFRYDATRGENYMIRARHRNGLYSPNVLEGQIGANPPDGFTLDIVNSQLELQVLASTGTAVGCTVDTGATPYVVRMDDGVYEASYTLPELDPGASAQRWWSLAVGIDVTDQTPLEQLADVTLGEMHWRTVRGRDASPQRPGMDMAVRSDSSTILIDDPSYTSAGRVGVLGHEVRAIPEMRFYDHTAGQWGPWTEWTADIITAQKVQARVRMERANLNYDVALTYIQLVRAN